MKVIKYFTLSFSALQNTDRLWVPPSLLPKGYLGLLRRR